MNTHRLLPPAGTLVSSTEWYAYYEANRDHLLAVPWEDGAQLTEHERNAIVASLAAWQLGETSDGSHLLASAREYAERIGDPFYVEAVRLFIQEEQRHGANLGRFLDIEGVPRLQRNWGDSLFRRVRYALPKMEVWTTPVIMVETLAMLYYRAIHDATNSTVLRTICRQILRDEVAHLRFQYERFAIMLQEKSGFERAVTFLLQRALYGPVVLLVWIGHQRALRAGGHSFGSYWRAAWKRMEFCWRGMRPERYPELQVPQGVEEVAPGLVTAVSRSRR